MSVGYNQPNMVLCNFNTNIVPYRQIYLCGTYNTTTGLFTLRDGGNAGSTLYYTVVPNNISNITLSDYFTSGYDYIVLGATYSTLNYMHLREVNTLFHFDGTNLVPYDTWLTNTKGTGTVTSVNNISPVNGNVTITSDNIMVGDDPSTGYEETTITETIYGLSNRIDSKADSSAFLDDFMSSSVSVTDETMLIVDDNFNFTWINYNPSAAQGGTDLSLVTTGEKYTWNNKVTKVNNQSPDGNGNVTIGASNIGYSGDVPAVDNVYDALDNLQAQVSSRSITNTSSTKSVTDGTNTLTFGSNAFNSTTIPTTYVSTVNGSSGAITNVAKTNVDNNFSVTQKINGVYIKTDGGLGFYDGTNFKKAIIAGSEDRPQYKKGTGTAVDLALYSDIPTDTNYYPSRSYSSGLQISTSQGVANTCALYVPYANGTSQSGVVSTTTQTIGGEKTFTTRPKYATSLPSGYQQVEYIQSTGSCYYNTGIAIRTDLDYVTLDVWQYTNNNANKWVFGTPTPRFAVNTYTNRNVEVNVGSGWVTSYTRLASLYDRKSRFQFTPVGFYFDGEKIADVTTSSSTDYLYIFSRSASTSALQSGTRFYGCTIVRNGVVTHNLVPCIQTSNSAVGLYDTIPGDFIYASGTAPSTTAAGPNVTSSNLIVASDLAAVATSGNYSDLLNKPTIPTSVNGLTGGTISSSTTISGDMVANYVKIASIGHETGTYDKILTLSSTNYVRYRTKAEMKSDLGIPIIDLTE